MVFIFAYIFSHLWTRLFGCSPPSKYWNYDIPGHCVSFRTANLIFSALNIFSDLFIMLLPLPMIWNMQLSWKGKIGISLVFMSGAMYVDPSVACQCRAKQKFNYLDSAGAVALMRTVYVVYDTYAVDRLAGKQCLWAYVMSTRMNRISWLTLMQHPRNQHGSYMQLHASIQSATEAYRNKTMGRNPATALRHPLV